MDFKKVVSEIANVQFDDRKDQIVLIGAGRESIEVRYRDSFFLTQEDATKLPRDWARLTEVEGDFVRVFWPEPVQGSRKSRLEYFQDSFFGPKKIRPLEADVDPTMRYLIEHPSLPMVKTWKVLWYDLETETVKDWSMPWKSRILSISWKSSTGRRGHIRVESKTDEAERRALMAFFKLADRHHILAAWNGSRFDDPVISNRAIMHGVPFDRYEYHWIDYLKIFKRYFSRTEDGSVTSSFALGSLSAALLGGVTKVPVDDLARAKGWNGTGDLFSWVWEHAPELLREYNDHDVSLMGLLEEKTSFLSLHLSLCELCRVLPRSGSLYPMTLVDGRMLQRGAEMSYHFPSRRGSVEDTHVQAKGAFVPEAVLGIHESVAVLDYTRMYVSIIRSFNMSLETLDPNGPIKVPETDEMGRTTSRTLASFRSEPEGHLPAALRGVIELRKQFSDRQKKTEVGSPEFREAERLSTACKVLGNTFYGVILSPISRFYLPEIGESVTSVGRFLLSSTIAEAAKRGHSLIFGDTDSIAIKVKNDDEANALKDAVNGQMIPRVVAAAGIPAGKSEISIDYEKRYARILVTASKRYAGRYALYKGKVAGADSPLDIRGLEIVRSDVSRSTRLLQREVLVRILDGQSAQEIRPWVIETMEKFRVSPPGIEELIMSKALTQKPEDYSTKPPHVRVATRLKEAGAEIGEGSKIQFVYLEGGLILHPSEKNPKQKLDYALYWNKYIYPPSERVLKAAFPSGKWEIRALGSLDQLGLFVGVQKAKGQEMEKPIRPVRKALVSKPIRRAVERRAEVHLRVDGEIDVPRLKDLLDGFPGQCTVKLTVKLKGVEVDMKTPSFLLVQSPTDAPKLAAGLRILGVSWTWGEDLRGGIKR